MSTEWHGIHSLRLDHHSAVDEGAVPRQRGPLMIPVVARQTSPEAIVEPPGAEVHGGTVLMVSVVVVLIVRREFHAVVRVVTEKSVAVVVAFILERVPT